MPSKGYKKKKVKASTLRQRRYLEKKNSQSQHSQPTRSSQRQVIAPQFYDEVPSTSNEFHENVGDNYSEIFDDEMIGDGISADRQHENDLQLNFEDLDTLQLDLSDREIPNFTDFEQILQYVALMCNLPHSAVNLLSRCLSQLLMMKNFIRKKLPLAQTILNTTRDAARHITSIRSRLNPGDIIGRYAHIGLRKGLTSVLRNFPNKFLPDNEIVLDFFIDGFAPHDNATHVKKMIAIMCRVVMKGIERSKCPIFLVGIYGGRQEPKTPAFLSQWVEEFNELFNNFEFSGKTFQIRFGMLLGDMIGRYWFLGTAGSTGLISCIKCKEPAVQLSAHLKEFPDKIGALRTDADYRMFVGEGNFFRITDGRNLPLLNLMDFDFIRNVAHCSLHGILLGTMKKQLELTLGLLEENNPLKIKLFEFTEQLFERYSTDFSRRGRYFKDWMKFKGHEYYDILMHYGPMIYQFLADNDEEIDGQQFQGKFDELRQANLLLHCSARMLYSHDLVQDDRNIEKTKEWLTSYIRRIKNIFGVAGHVTPNGHQLLHFPDQCKIYGSLRNVDGSCFENYINRLAEMLRFPNRELEQYVCRASELDILQRFKIPSSSYQHKNIQKSKKVAKTIVIDGRSIHCNNIDGFLLLEDGSLCRALGFIKSNGRHFVEVFKYPKEIMESFYTDPVNSKFFNIFLVRNFESRRGVRETALVSNIEFKLSCYVWSKTNSHLIFTSFSKLAHPPITTTE